MEAKLVEALPAGAAWQYEPKWDGFRCIIFRQGAQIRLQSKSEKPLDRYFPELMESVAKIRAKQFVLDGEIVIPAENGVDFDQLLQRIHPAASRVRKLAAEHPAHFMAFDLLGDESGRDLLKTPLAERRPQLERFAQKYFSKIPRLHLSPATTALAQAQQWLEGPGCFLDGLIAKRLDLPYAPGERSAMQKFKRIRTADCVVGGFRYAGHAQEAVGSLLLGLYEGGLLHHVGFTSGIAQAERTKLLRKLKPLIQAPGFTGHAPGGPSRWSTERSESWQPLRPELVVEVSFDHVTQNRFRHGTRILRWRPDKAPEQCTMEQITPTATGHRPVFDLIG
ncbi:MAG TPA: ATP-dependent DNA ligase, partial [Verrucomicrobiae bacterium]|nr:ATP-dependent DNA ligase [Verrucomicrobiae bacterium]